MSERLKIQRLLKKLQQKDVAKILGISTATYCMKEQGKRDWTLREIKILMELFDKKFDELF